MTTLSSLFYIPKKTGDFGIEFEQEANTSFEISCPKTWAVHGDDSLRNFGIEFVSKSPVAEKEVFSHIDLLMDYIDSTKENGIVYDDDSDRTSTHVHMNVGNFTPVQFVNLLTTYWLIEDVLSEFCGKSRKANLFCLRLTDAEGPLFSVVEGLISKSNNYEFFAGLSMENYKYGAINLASVFQYGSLEFRMMRGLTDRVVAKEWLGVLIDLKKYAMNAKNPEEILESLINLGGYQFLCSVISSKKIRSILSVSEIDSIVNEKTMIISILAYAADWELWSKKVNSVKPVKNNKPKQYNYYYSAGA